MTSSSLDPKEREKRVKEDKDFTSQKIGDLARNIGYGVLAICFTLLTSNAQFSEYLTKRNGVELRVAAILAIASVLFDYLQYLAGYIDSARVMNSASYKYSKISPFYIARKIFYWAKQLFAVLAALVLLITVVGATN